MTEHPAAGQHQQRQSHATCHYQRESGAFETTVGGTTLIAFSTLANNVNNVAATGIITTGGPTALRNLIVSGAGGVACSGPGTKVLAGTNFLPDNLCGLPFQNTNPLLGPLADNGGPTLSHALLAGSPASNAADPCTIATDQRGLPRLYPCDVGAYEFGGAPTLTSLNPPAANHGTGGSP